MGKFKEDYGGYVGTNVRGAERRTFRSNGFYCDFQIYEGIKMERATPNKRLSHLRC